MMSITDLVKHTRFRCVPVVNQVYFILDIFLIRHSATYNRTCETDNGPMF